MIELATVPSLMLGRSGLGDLVGYDGAIEGSARTGERIRIQERSRWVFQRGGGASAASRSAQARVGRTTSTPASGNTQLVGVVSVPSPGYLQPAAAWLSLLPSTALAWRL
jgi:hypothetical protein